MNIAKTDPAPSNDTVFLSVIVHRRHRSLPLLDETLLAFAGQTCPDFEIVIAGEESETSDDEAVQSLIGRLSPALREKCRLVPSFGKTRAEALNHALDHASGRMASFIDEGDLPFDNWVECLRETARDRKCVVYAYAIEQVWEFDSMKDAGNVLRSVGKLDPSSCHPFDIVDSLAAPEFRGTSFAFPMSSPDAEPLRFDETLRALERWDYLLRAFNAYPLATFDEPASLARIWRKPADPSMRPTIWDETIPLPDEAEATEERLQVERRRIVERLEASAPRIAALYDPHAPVLQEADPLSRQALARRCVLSCHPADGDPFDAPVDIGLRVGWTLRWTMEPHAAPLDRIELALEGMRGCITVSSFVCAVEDACGEEHRFDLASCEHNGLQIDCGHAIFLAERPALALRFAAPVAPARIHLKIEVRKGAAEEHVGQFTRGNVALWAGRMKRWALRRANRL